MAGSRILRAILKASKEVGERPATRRAVAEAVERRAAREAAEASRAAPMKQWFDSEEQVEEAIDAAIRMKALEGRIVRESSQLRGRPKEIAPSWEYKAGRTQERVYNANVERMKEIEARGGPKGFELNQALIDISRKHRGDLRKTAQEFEQLLDSLLAGHEPSLRKLRELSKTRGGN